MRTAGVGTTGINAKALVWNGHIFRGNTAHRHRGKSKQMQLLLDPYPGSHAACTWQGDAILPCGTPSRDAPRGVLHAEHCTTALQPYAPAMGIVTQWAIRLQTSDFYGPPPPTPNTQAPHDRPPPRISD